MKLNLRGHEDRYAIEQSLLAFFPEERPVYEGEDGDSHAEVTLHEGNVYATGVTTLTYGGKTARGEARVRTAGVSDAYERERLRQRALKLSFFRAARDVTGVTPSWGALTGIRPAKLVRTMLEDGMTPAQADRVLRDTYCVSPARRRLALESAEAGLKARSDLRPEDISLYIGIPFCPTRCAYCSFVSASVEKSFKLMEPYLAALLHEIEACAEMAREMGLHIRVGYIGGGTPSSLTTPQLDRLLAHVEKHFGALAEFTVEAGRPDTLDAQKLRMLRDHPVTRISINPQTMNDATLTRIGRAHTAKQTVEAYELARSIGFDDINMDVIAALPGEDYAMFAHTLAEIRRLRPESLTVHTLAIKRSSRLHEEKYAQAEQDVARMVALGRQTAHDMGMRAYYLYRQKYMAENLENVGYALPGRFCRYNIDNMEETTSILALGAGGISKCVMREEEKILRAPNIANIEQYIDRVDEMIERKRIVFAEKAKKLD